MVCYEGLSVLFTGRNARTEKNQALAADKFDHIHYIEFTSSLAVCSTNIRSRHGGPILMETYLCISIIQSKW